jgi:FixJ family two-component response regulator
VLALRVVAKCARYGVTRLANGTTIGFGSRLVSGAFGNNGIRPPNENTPWVNPTGRMMNTYIAVVDDEISLCTSLSRLLRLANFSPISYPSAEAFLADEKQPRFDCLLLDIRLEGMSGMDLFRHLIAQKRNIPVIFITAFDDPALRREAFALGCAGFFRKSTPGAEIIEAIRSATAPKEQAL